MSISIEHIRHLAKLSKLKLTAQQEEKYSKEISSIISFLETLPDQKWDKKTDTPMQITPFITGIDYPHPHNLLQNTKHKLKNDAIAIKTSLSH